jgi:DNA polymerase III delta subunit
MKIKPELFLIKNEDLGFKNIIVAGSDDSFRSVVTEHIVNKLKNKNYFIDFSGSINSDLTGDLFSDKKVLFLIKDKVPDDDVFEKNTPPEQTILVSSSNNKKVNAFKFRFSNSKHVLVIDCYSLSRAAKELVIKNFIEKNQITISKDIYWYILENFENEYVLLLKQLEKIQLYGNKISSVNDVDKIAEVENKIEINKIFFHLLKNNSSLIRVFNKNIYSQADFYIFLNSIKLYLSILSNSSNKDILLSKFPKYLFNEKEVFLKIYKNLGREKIRKIYKNIYKAEALVRKNSELHTVIGLRFLINTKKIIIS